MEPFRAQYKSRIKAGVVLEPHDDQARVIDAVRQYYEQPDRSPSADTMDRLSELDYIQTGENFHGSIVISGTEAHAAVESLYSQAEASSSPAEVTYITMLIKGLERAQNASVLYYVDHRQEIDA